MVRRTLNQIEFLFDEIKENKEESREKAEGSFELFCDEFEDFSKEETLEVMFKYIFKESMKRLDRNPVLDSEPRKRNDRNKKVPISKIKADQRGNVRLFVNVGKDDGVSLQDLVFNVSDELNLDQRKVRNVQLKERFSFLDVPLNCYEELVFESKMAIGKKTIRFEPTNNHIVGAENSGDRSARGGRGGFSSRGPRGRSGYRGQRSGSRSEGRGGNRGGRNGNRGGNYGEANGNYKANSSEIKEKNYNR